MPVIYPGQMIGIIGNDQRAFLLALEAKKMGYKVAMIVNEQLQASPLATILDASVIGDYHQYADLERLGDICQVLTYTDELLDETLLERLAQAYYLPQGSSVLSVTQDRYLERVFLDDLNINIPPSTTVVDEDDIRQGIDSIGYPCILKPIQKGFGKQYQRFIKAPADLEGIGDFLQLGSYLLESWIPNAQELSVMVTKTAQGQTTVLPVVENDYHDHQLALSLVPARIDQAVAAEIERLAQMISQHLDYVGVFGIEFFLTPDMNIYVKRIIPTPHISGNVLNRTLNFSQYEYHLKAICQLAVSDYRLNNAGVTLNIDANLQQLVKTQMKIKPDWYFNLYQVKPQVTSGFITTFGTTVAPLLEKLEAADLYHAK